LNHSKNKGTKLNLQKFGNQIESTQKIGDQINNSTKLISHYYNNKSLILIKDIIIEIQ